MREIILDVETTGMNKKKNNDINHNHRIVEIGCVEVINKEKTSKKFHTLVNPEQPIDKRATEIHGIGDEDVKSAPRFIDIAEELIKFIQGAVIVIHNASFDIAFLNAEFDRLPPDMKPKGTLYYKDTLELSRSLFPNMKNDLDTLSNVFNVKMKRDTHTALLDAEILCDIYLKMSISYFV